MAFLFREERMAIEFRMSGRAGQAHTFKGGFWNLDTHRWILFCTECGEQFETSRIHTKTCSAACRKRRSRRLGGL